MVPSRSDRYRVLSTTLGHESARALIDRLQVLALTQPDALREMEVFLERGALRGPTLGCTLSPIDDGFPIAGPSRRFPRKNAVTLRAGGTSLRDTSNDRRRRVGSAERTTDLA